MVEDLAGNDNMRALSQGHNSQFHHLLQDRIKCRKYATLDVYVYHYQ